MIKKGNSEGIMKGFLHTFMKCSSKDIDIERHEFYRNTAYKRKIPHSQVKEDRMNS